jgi:hypothetical protein
MKASVGAFFTRRVFPTPPPLGNSIQCRMARATHPWIEYVTAALPPGRYPLQFCDAGLSRSMMRLEDARSRATNFRILRLGSFRNVACDLHEPDSSIEVLASADLNEFRILVIGFVPQFLPLRLQKRAEERPVPTADAMHDDQHRSAQQTRARRLHRGEPLGRGCVWLRKSTPRPRRITRSEPATRLAASPAARSVPTSTVGVARSAPPRATRPRFHIANRILATQFP